MRKAAVILALAVTTCQAKWWHSALAVAGATTLDFASSLGRQEMNLLMRGPGGTFSPSRAAGIKAGATGGSLLIQLVVKRRTREWNKQFETGNWIGAGFYGTLAVRNWKTR